MLSDYSLRKYCDCATALSVMCALIVSFALPHFFPKSPDFFGELDADN